MFFIVLVLPALIVGGAVAFGKRRARGGSSRLGYGAGPGAVQQSYDADAGAGGEPLGGAARRESVDAGRRWQHRRPAGARRRGRTAPGRRGATRPRLLPVAVRAGDADRDRGAAPHPQRPHRAGARPGARAARAGCRRSGHGGRADVHRVRPARHEHAVLPPGRGGRRPFRAGRLVPHALVEDRLCRGCRRSRGHGARGRAVRRVPPSRAARGVVPRWAGGPGGFRGFGGPGPL